MILSKPEILKAIEKKEIQIIPFNKECVGPCSVDMHLGNAFRVFRKKQVIDFRHLKEYEKVSDYVELKKSECLTIKPGELVLGVTKEKLVLSNSLCGRIEGRSRFARMGLLVHVSSSLIQPGVSNVQVLEIMNMSPVAMKLYPGLRICQIVFEELKGRAKYEGVFKAQTKP